MTDEGTYRPNGSLEDQLDELNNIENAENIPGPNDDASPSGMGGTADPLSSWNREEGLKRDRRRMEGEDDDDVVDIYDDDLEDTLADDLEDVIEEDIDDL